MNNEQFRRLLLANASKSSGADKNDASPATSRLGPGATPALGSRQKSSIPMTPRSVAGAAHVNFARQLAERDQSTRPQKKIRSSAPKGSRFAEGYVDRARLRESEEEDERAARIKALEESFKKEEIDQETFEKLRNEIAGGDLSSTHLIKGLDFKLLERIKKGEDVFHEKKDQEKPAEDEPGPEPEAELDEAEEVDDAFEELEEKEVAAITKEKKQKKGQLATTTLVPGQKRTRDQILAQLKAAREAAKAQQESALGSKFKKISTKKEPGTRIERDSKGREVLIIVDEDGHEKRKIRKIAPDAEKEREAFKPDPTAKPLGMEVPEYYRKKQEEEEAEEKDREIHIFSDVESDYDPLAGLDSDSDSDESDASGDEDKEKAKPKAAEGASPRSEGEVSAGSPVPSRQMAPPPKPQAPPQARNYFKDSKSTLISEDTRRGPALNDPAVLAALKKAKALNAATKSEEEEQEAARKERLKKMLESSERDAQDMDLGFGTNRMEDEEDSEEKRVKLSAWGGGDDGDAGGGGKAKRKRGPKKKKGDVNSAADVLSVLEKRKAAGS
ncbi:Protein Red [Pleurostoma richardsiae]|uniref:Protein Red n=1 Tax=Pleurostoma richardsiae TaxID=41990 RepID=A0AA38W0H0_9PEZI|nr:Protein Red [Pleurostoma richardsiae]